MLCVLATDPQITKRQRIPTPPHVQNQGRASAPRAYHACNLPPSQSVSAWYGEIKPRVCTPDPTPQVLQQQVMYKPRKQKRAKVEAPATATQEDDKECHKFFFWSSDTE